MTSPAARLPRMIDQGGRRAQRRSRSPSWSPDGKQIAFTSRDVGILDIWLMNADGTNRHQLTHVDATEGQAQMPAWSADGRQIAMQVSNSKAHTSHIWIVNVSAGATRKLAPHTRPYFDEVPRWFPDGKRLIFQSDRTGRMQLWVMNTDGSKQRQVTK